MAADENESVGRLVGAGLLALGRLAPRGDRMTAAGGAAFAAAVRMIDRVHRDAAVMRLAAEPAATTGLADRNVHVIRVGHCADRSGAAAGNQALLLHFHPNHDIVLAPPHR